MHSENLADHALYQEKVKAWIARTPKDHEHELKAMHYSLDFDDKHAKVIGEPRLFSSGSHADR